MDLADIVELVRSRCGNIQSFAFTSSIQATLQYVATTKLERDSTLRPWFMWNVAETPVAALSGASTLNLPADYLFSDPDSFLKKQGEFSFYKRIRPEQADAVNETCTKVYYIRNNKVYFNPVLTENTNFVMDYQGALGDLQDSNPWCIYAADLLAAEAAYELKMTMGDEAGARLEATRGAQARARLTYETIERSLGTQI